MKKINFRHTPGIRWRIILHLIAFVVFVIALIWLFQITLLDQFYRAYNIHLLHSTDQAIAQNLDNQDLSVLAERLAEENDVCILLLDEEGNVIISADVSRRCMLHKMRHNDLSWWVKEASKSDSPIVKLFTTQPISNGRYNENGFSGNVPPKDPATNQSCLFINKLTASDGSVYTLMMNIIITPVSSTVKTLRSQLTVITLIVLAGAIILALLISHRVSLPIIETSNAARMLSKGQFTAVKHKNNYREIAELNQTLLQAADELNKVENLQHELIANISHDLRTPLTMIGGYAEMIRDIPSEGTPENMQVIIDETNRLSSLVNELLDFSRLQTGCIELHSGRFCLTESIQQIIGRIAAMTEKDGYNIHFSPGEIVFCEADEKRIGQVIYNLLGNALTYTGSNKTVLVHQDIRDKLVRVSIEDSGSGIPPEELANIWERYYRTKETHRRAVIGSGLGLNIVQAILKQHDAPYGVDSMIGQGTTFWFELPIVPSDND